MRAILFSILVVAAAACGNKSKGPETPEGGGTEEHGHDAEHHEHPAMPAELTAFHDHLAPLWHSEAPDRKDATCKDAGVLLGLGADIQGAPAPEGAAADWSDRVNSLLLAIDQMKEGCQSGTGDFEADFTAVHDGFHGLLDALPKG
jgi:hypothetical protein